MAPRIHQTKDGSSTLYSEQFDQFYHNPNGAVSESKHVFFEKPELLQFLEEKEHVDVFEIGFGTGLNFLLLLDQLQAQYPKASATFNSVEVFPVDAETARTFKFADHLDDSALNDILPGIFENLKPGYNQFRPVGALDVELRLFVGPFRDYRPDVLQADFIFHDPFSPSVNPELWTPEVFAQIAEWSKPDGVLATYCAASKARAAMAIAGWKVARVQGALGKREMTLASRNPSKLRSHKRVNEERLIYRHQKGDFK